MQVYLYPLTIDITPALVQSPPAFTDAEATGEIVVNAIEIRITETNRLLMSQEY